MKTNYDEEMLKIAEKNKGKTILLHSCCGPCSSYVIEELAKYFCITVLYYNPNIEPYEEYEHRKQEQIRLIEEYQKMMPVSYLDCDYDNERYTEQIMGLEKEKEGGRRCEVCFRLRLLKTAQEAKNRGYDFFGTTLTVSPHKNATLINQIGKELEKEIAIPFLPSDFKKREGYKKSIINAKKLALYRQDYCGCSYSKEERYENQR